MNKTDITRTILEATIDKALNDIQSDAFRSIRNLIDLGLNFSTGRFQKSLFGVAQTMLEREDSAYYSLVQNAVERVNHQTLKTFGVNLGYNGCTNGAKVIRDNEAAFGFNIPWAIAFQLDASDGAVTVDALSHVVAQGKQLGVFTYMIFCGGKILPEIVSLFEMFDDCAFILFSPSELLEPDVIDMLKCCHNLMLSVATTSSQWLPVAQQLHQKQFLYAVHHFYQEDNCSQILSKEWIESILPSQCIFAFLLPEPACCMKIQNQVSSSIRKIREEQKYPVILMEVFSDLLMIDHIISDGACSIAFDASGQAILPGRKCEGADYNFRQTPLKKILQHSMPRVVKSDNQL